VHPLALEILGTPAEPAVEAADPRLRRLLDRARAGEGDLLRASPRRVVLRLPDAGDWLLKVDRPRRALESLRGILRTPGGLREARLAQRLATRLPGWDGPFLGEALRGGASVYARPFLAGTPLDRALPAAAALVPAGLARLHAAGWTDPDLLPGDLLLDADGRLLPLDLGGAQLRRGPARRADVRRDLLLLLAGLDAPLAAATVATWRAPDSQQVLLAAARLRARRLHRQSRRCLRRTRDFLPGSDGSVRREPAPRGVERCWPFPNRRQAARFWRALYERELHGEPVPRVTVLEKASRGGWQVRAVEPTAEDGEPPRDRLGRRSTPA
jgi:hypothetical protein